MIAWRLRSKLWIPQRPEDVFPFFADAQNLSELTPPWLSFAIATPTPIDMHDGTLIDYKIRVRGLPMGWRTRISRWDPPRAFVDEQLRGPYALWHHTHTFVPVDGGTQLGDEVLMRPRGGPLAGLLMRLMVRRDVESIFRYRTEVMAQRFGGDARSGELEWTTIEVDPRDPAAVAAAG